MDVNGPIRVLVAKPGLDGHDRGALVVAQGLRDAGMEVIYTGLRQSAEQIVRAALDEDVDCIGLSSLSGAHMALFSAVLDELRRAGGDDILVIGGGVIPPEDAAELRRRGLAAVFTPGSPIRDMADFIRENVRRSGAAPAPPLAIDHVGIAVENIAEALLFYERQLGCRLEAQEDIPAQQVRVALLRVGDAHIELLEPLGDDSPVAKFLRVRGPGMHHLAYLVDDVAAWLARARADGLQVLDDAPRPGAAHRLVGFVHPKSASGVLTEYCQVVEDH